MLSGNINYFMHLYIPNAFTGVDKSLFEQLASPQDENVTEIIDGSKGVNR